MPATQTPARPRRKITGRAALRVDDMTRPAAAPVLGDEVQDLAADLSNLAASTGAALETDLAGLGWSPADLDRLMPAARARLARAHAA